MNILQVKDLTVKFNSPNGEFTAVDGVSFDIAKGEVFGIVGESGSGKTLTALSILKLVPYPGRIVSGEVLYRGKDILGMDDESIRATRGARISMVFQEPGTSFDPVFTIGSQLVEAITAHDPLKGKKKAREIAMDYLEKVHIKDAIRVYGSYPHQISGGMKQRVMIAMALINSPDLVILDEPTTALDVTIQAQILSLLEEIKEKEDLSMLFISHDLGVIARIAGRVAVMKSGRIVETGERSRILSDPREEYTIKLLESVKRLS
jgi:ABC-type dipeptide/oligopeptide/nickel transport system ATPase component